MKELTKAEEQVMEYLWKLERAFVRDILDEFPEPKPAYTTVSTIVRILEKKELVGYTAFGKNYQYFPLVSKKEYAWLCFRGVLSKHFNSSVRRFASFFASDSKVSLSELEEMKELLEKEIEKRKTEEANGAS
jgi:predicted transcriptional regulator